MGKNKEYRTPYVDECLPTAAANLCSFASMQWLRYLLFPFAVLYELITRLRNKLYDNGTLRSVSFDFPIIAIGNLSVGGTGKTPHIEYLIRLLAPHFRLATLSRGYRRKTQGFRMAKQDDTAETIGDEPMLLKLKYPQVSVAVGEERALAIPQIISATQDLQAILMDDAMQHRAIEPGLMIMLTEYDSLFTRDYVMPMGSLREARSAYKRAQFIVVTKCPPEMSAAEQEVIRKEIDPQPGQLVFFSYLKYGTPYKLANNPDPLQADADTDVLLVCGIANPKPLQEHLAGQFRNVYLRDFPDHHQYSQDDMESITRALQNIEHQNKAIVTTEKDAARFYRQKNWILVAKLPIFVQPVMVEFFPESKKLFDGEILKYMSKVVKHI